VRRCKEAWYNDCTDCGECVIDYGALNRRKKEAESLEMSKQRARENFNIEDPTAEVEV